MQCSRVFVILSLLYSWGAGGGMAEAQEMRDLYTTRDEAGRERVYRVPESKLLATKKWSPESEAPPLSVRAAVTVALKRLGPKHPSGLRVVKIELIASGGQEWRWFYRIEFFDSARARGARPPDLLEVLVLMDGTVVEPSPDGRSR
jgi:hypothetical protein